jgi:8-oxo-dGTP pyrophosphatase MutT (NUDIX family)
MVLSIRGVLIQDRQALMVTTKGYDFFPGGKKDFHGEPDDVCLKREFIEELSGTEILIGDYFRTSSGKTPNSGTKLYTKLYFCYPVDKIGEPSAEITHKKFVSSKDIPKLNLTETSRKNLLSLIKYGLID